MRHHHLPLDDVSSPDPALLSSKVPPDSRPHNERLAETEKEDEGNQRRINTGYSTTRSRFQPACGLPPGRTWLAIGQDYFSVDEYLREQLRYAWYHLPTAPDPNATKQNQNATKDETPSTAQAATNPTVIPTRASFLPDAVMIYTDLPTLHGLDQPIDYGAGVEYGSGLVELLTKTTSSTSSTILTPTTQHGPVLQIGLWLNGAAGCQQIIQGHWDDALQRLWQYLASVTVPSSPPLDSSSTNTMAGLVPWVVLRIGYEFDNPQFGYADDPSAFRQAFTYIVQNCRRYRLGVRPLSTTWCRDKLIMVWHSWAAGLPTYGNKTKATWIDFYPGDEVVDWIGVSIFSQKVSPPQDTVQQVVDFARQRALPKHCLATSSSSSFEPSRLGKPLMIAESTPFGGISHFADPWQDWFVPVLEWIQNNRQPSVALWSYIDCNWPAQPMWAHAGFGDTRLATNETLMCLWQHHVLNNPRFSQTLWGMDSQTVGWGDWNYRDTSRCTGLTESGSRMLKLPLEMQIQPEATLPSVSSRPFRSMELVVVVVVALAVVTRIRRRIKTRLFSSGDHVPLLDYSKSSRFDCEHVVMEVDRTGYGSTAARSNRE